MRLCDHLYLPDAQERTIRKWVNKTWTSNVVATLSVLFGYMLQSGTPGIKLCELALCSSKRGAVCELQVTFPSSVWLIDAVLAQCSIHAHCQCCRGTCCSLERLQLSSARKRFSAQSVEHFVSCTLALLQTLIDAVLSASSIYVQHDSCNLQQALCNSSAKRSLSCRWVAVHIFT